MYMKTPFSQLNLSSIEHLCVEYHVEESQNCIQKSPVRFVLVSL
jgi:hypothetical protein